MEVIFTTLALASALSMFLVDKPYKVAILLVSYMLFSMVTLPVANVQIVPIISLCLLLSEFRRLWFYLKKLLKSQLLLFIGAALLTGIVSVIHSEHLHTIMGMAAFVADEWILKAFALLYSSFLIRTSKDIKIVLRASVIGIAVMTVFAVMNYILGYSPVCESLYNESLDGYDFIRSSRFRVQSTFINPFDYGFMCLVCFFLHTYGLLTSKESIPTALVCLASCIFGIVTCNCRTILLCLLICSLVYLCALNKDRKKKWTYLACFVGLGLLAFLLVPAIHKLVLSMLTIFDSYSGVEGSSINARWKQFAAVISHIDGHYLFGRGVGYFNYDVGWVNGAESASDHSLLGLEGVLLSMLLERGAVGCIIYFFEMLILLRIIRKMRFLSRNEYTISITVFTAYLLFAFMTGELLSFPVSLLCIGIFYGVHSRKLEAISILLIKELKQ